MNVTTFIFFSGTLKAHSHNVTGSCWKRYPNGADGDENCLTLDIYTSSVVYSNLRPVVVYIDGDDLSQEVNILFSNFSCRFLNPNNFSNLNYNCSIFWDLRNLQEQVKKAFYYQKLFWSFTVWISCSSDLKIFKNSH